MYRKTLIQYINSIAATTLFGERARPSALDEHVGAQEFINNLATVTQVLMM